MPAQPADRPDSFDPASGSSDRDDRPAADRPPIDPAAAATAATPGRPQPARGFFSSQIRALLATAAVIVALGAGSIPWLLSSPDRVADVAARLLPELQADVRCGGVRLGWMGPLVFEDVRLVPRDGSHTPVTIRRIELSHGLAGILLSLGDLGRLRIDGLEADVVFDAERDSNLKGLFRPVEPEAPAGTAAESPRGPRKSLLRLEVDVVDALVRISGPWSPEIWVSDPIDIRAALARAPAGHSEWRIAPVQLLSDARLEPSVAQGVLAYIAPLLADATRTGGRFSLRLDGGTLPVGAPEEGALSGKLSMHAVDVGPGPLVTRAIEALPIQLPGPPTIRIADESRIEFRLADRKMWHQGLRFGVPLAKSGQRLDVQSSGSVNLDDKSLDIKLELPIPADLPQDRPLLASLAGRSVSLRVGGALGEPRINFDGSIKATAGQVAVDLIDRLKNRSPAPRPAAEPKPLAPPPPAPRWRGDAAADGGRGGGEGPDSPATAAAKPADGAAAGVPEKLDGVLAPGATAEQTAEKVIDLVGGVLGEVARRRAERQAAEAANPEQTAQPRRGRLLRRLIQPPAPAEQPPQLAPTAPSPAP
jgi:hypothetical protein